MTSVKDFCIIFDISTGIIHFDSLDFDAPWNFSTSSLFTILQRYPISKYEYHMCVPIGKLINGSRPDWFLVN